MSKAIFSGTSFYLQMTSHVRFYTLSTNSWRFLEIWHLILKVEGKVNNFLKFSHVFVFSFLRCRLLIGSKCWLFWGLCSNANKNLCKYLWRIASKCRNDAHPRNEWKHFFIIKWIFTAIIQCDSWNSVYLLKPPFVRILSRVWRLD